MKTLREFLEEAKQFQVEEVIEDEIDLDEVEDEDEELEEDGLEEEAPKGYGGRAVTGSRAGYWKSMRQGERDAAYVEKQAKQYNAAKRKRAMGEEVEQIDEAADVELKPHPNGTHYIVHKIHPKSGIESDQMKVGEKISDTHVDDLHDMGYQVKIHKK